jgi:hypothetical protein
METFSNKENLFTVNDAKRTGCVTLNDGCDIDLSDVCSAVLEAAGMVK